MAEVVAVAEHFEPVAVGEPAVQGELAFLGESGKLAGYSSLLC